MQMERREAILLGTDESAKVWLKCLLNQGVLQWARIASQIKFLRDPEDGSKQHQRKNYKAFTTQVNPPKFLHRILSHPSPAITRVGLESLLFKPK